MRTYVRSFPVQSGKGRIRRAFLDPVLPPEPFEFVTTEPLGGKISLRYREELGFNYLVYGGFETAEIIELCRLARPRTAAVDVGANVGIFTVALARAVGPDGSVVAFEPLEENTARLEANLERNALVNVDIHTEALADREGTIEMTLSEDPAYGSTVNEHIHKASGGSASIRVTRLDRVWAELGDPELSVLKIDVEGGELAVLHGAMRILRSQSPAILIEAHDDRLAPIEALLGPLGYRRSQPVGFQRWNHLLRRSQLR